MGVEELETFLFGSSDVAGMIAALAENACDDHGTQELDDEGNLGGDS